MRHINQRLLPILLFFFSSIAYTQTVQVKGVVREEIPLREGKIIVFLPDDIRTGEVISGTVTAEPSGNNEKEKNRNLTLLQQYRVISGTVSANAGGAPQPLRFIRVGQGALPLTVLDGKNNVIKTISVPVAANTALPVRGMSVPTHSMTGSPFRITGAFDGDLGTTRCSIDGKAVEILAESPRQTVCRMPATSSGSHTLVVEENGVRNEKNISAVDMQLSSPKTNLRRGEQTTLTVSISGLQGLPSAANLLITNTSTSTISLQGGNTQVITITPQQTAGNGNFSQTFSAQSINTGNFTVSADLNLPEPPSQQTAPLSGPAGLCNCYINQQSYLLPPGICNSLGGSTGSPAPVQPVPATGNTPDNKTYPVINFPVPPASNNNSGSIRLHLTDLSGDVAVVLFSSRPVSGNNWTPVGTAENKGNNWEYNWTAPLGNDGEHVIRARIADKNNTVTDRYTNIVIRQTPLSINPAPGERINLPVTDARLKKAEEEAKKITDSLHKLQERIDALQKQYRESTQQQEQNNTMAEELATIDQVLDKIPGLYRDSLQALADSLKKLQGNQPPPPDPAALGQAAADAEQKKKDCEDRLNELKKEKEKLQNEKESLRQQIGDLLKQMDQLHLGNNWIGRSGFHPNGRFWYGYVGDENSNTNIRKEANDISRQLNALKKPHLAAINRLKNLDAEIAAAEDDCKKLGEASEQAKQAVQNQNQAAAVVLQLDELNRQIRDLLAALQKWCVAHPGTCSFGSLLDALLKSNPHSPADVQGFMDKLENLLDQKKQKEEELEKAAGENSTSAADAANEISGAEADKKALEAEQKKKQEEADRLRTEREKQLEAEREKKRKKDEEDLAKKNTPVPQPSLPAPVNPSDEQLKFQAIGSVLRILYRDYWIEKGPCDCITKALALANNTNTAATDIIGNLAVGVAFAPLEAFPGLSFGAKLGIGALKALGSALYGGQNFTEELAKNLFNVIGGEIFPELLGDDFTGSRANELASGGLDALLKASGVRAISWEGETELRHCGKVKGKTTMLFNPNTGWVTLMIKIDNCPLIVVKYKVNKDGVPVTKPTVQKVSG